MDIAGSIRTMVPRRVFTIISLASMRTSGPQSVIESLHIETAGR